MATTDGGPAFPTMDAGEADRCPSLQSPGMSLRDYFAAKAVAGILTNSDLPDLFKRGFAPSKAAEVAYAVADAMLAQRAAGGPAGEG